MNDKYYDPQMGVEYSTWDYISPDLRPLGCIPSVIQAEKARKYGKPSDEENIAQLAAPWDATDKPAIIQWSPEWKAKLEEDAKAFDILRDYGKLPPVWEIAKFFRYDLDDLCMSMQKTNDCTAWGVSRAAICLALFQKWTGAEINVEKLNPTGVYAYSSGKTPEAHKPFPDTGRTIYAIAQAACETGNFTAKSIGNYTGEARFTPEMINSIAQAEKNQMGFVYLGGEKRTGKELAEIVLLSLRACRPVIIGNTVALRDGTNINSDGVRISAVGGGWGGGHCTCAADVKKVGNNYYPWIYNSHGAIYPARDGSPDGGTYIDRDGLERYLSGTYTDVMPTTYVERPRVEYYDLNAGGRSNG